MHILADENIPLLSEFFAGLGEIRTLPGRNMRPDDVAWADVLLVRSVTQVNADLLALAGKLRFVGTCTIGTDHIDTAYLTKQHIGFASAPGCNAEAVVNYVISALLVIAERKQVPLTSLAVGIVGLGNVGGRLRHRLNQLGLHTLGVDPFKPHSDTGSVVELNQALLADVLCLHTPLTYQGSHPTYHLIGTQQLAKMRPDACLLNAGRGPVIDNAALLAHLKAEPLFSAVLDVWEDEPRPDLALLKSCLLATPHIAGYSLDGKMRGTEMVYQALCQHLGLAIEQSLANLLPEPPVLGLQTAQFIDPEERYKKLARAFYDVRDDDGRMRHACLHSSNLAHTFDALRKDYPLRRDLPMALLYD